MRGPRHAPRYATRLQETYLVGGGLRSSHGDEGQSTILAGAPVAIKAHSSKP